MSHPRCHVFVCVNQRGVGNRPSCGQAGRALATLLQRKINQDDVLVGEVAITATECLGDCFSGPVAVVYPQASWHEPAEADAILAVVRQGLGGS